MGLGRAGQGRAGQKSLMTRSSVQLQFKPSHLEPAVALEIVARRGRACSSGRGADLLSHVMPVEDLHLYLELHALPLLATISRAAATNSGV